MGLIHKTYQPENAATGCPKKNCPVVFMLISQLNLNIDPVKAEIFEVKYTRGHCYK